MKENIIKVLHDEYSDCPTYNHLKNIVNTILIKDLKSYYTISERTLRRYAHGDTLPKQPDVIKAIAKLCKVTPDELMTNLRDYKKSRDKNDKKSENV